MGGLKRLEGKKLGVEVPAGESTLTGSTERIPAEVLNRAKRDTQLSIEQYVLSQQCPSSIAFP